MSDLIGYQLCACGAWVPDEMAWLTDGRCLACHRAHLGRTVEPIIVRARGQMIEVARVAGTPAEVERRRRKNLAKAAKRKHDPKHKRRRHQSDHAKRRALRRLKALFPDVYDLLLTEEREAMGLPAYTAHRATASASAERAYETLERLGIYHPAP